MSGFVDALVIVVVATVVIARQFRARRIDGERRWWLLPVILVVLALREPVMLDTHHHTASALLFGAELLVGLATGAAWAWTTRIWAEPDHGLEQERHGEPRRLGRGHRSARRPLRARHSGGRAPGQLRAAAGPRRHPARPGRNPVPAWAVPAPWLVIERGVR